MKKIGKIGVVLLLGIVVVMTSISCSSGISQAEYDRIVDELTEAQNEIADLEDELEQIKSIEVEGVESSLKYQELKKDFDAVTGELESAEASFDALTAQHEGLQNDYETLQAQNESNLNQIDLLKNEKAQLQVQLDELTPPFPYISTGNLEQTLITRLNQERANAGLVALEPGSHLINWSRLNSEAMSVAKQRVIYDANWVPYQLHFIAGGYNTLEDIIDAIMIIWPSNTLSYQNNVLADDALYGAVGVVETGGIFYITFMASNFP